MAECRANVGFFFNLLKRYSPAEGIDCWMSLNQRQRLIPGYPASRWAWLLSSTSADPAVHVVITALTAQILHTACQQLRSRSAIAGQGCLTVLERDKMPLL